MTASQDTSLEDLSATSRRERREDHLGGLCLVIVGEGRSATFPLPDAGVVVVGRGDRSDICINHRSVSRSHAVLTIGGALSVEDLDSANGTYVREARLVPNTPTAVALGEPIDLGSVTVAVQQRAAPIAPRRMWAHGSFEARVEDECARAALSGGRFAVLRLRCDGADAAIAATLSRVLRALDIIGYYGPAEYEVLLPDSGPDLTVEISARLRAALAEARTPARIGVALYPTDARDPATLLRRAHALAHGPTDPAIADGPILVANPAMQSLDAIVQRIAAGTIGVLITGETGVGKEVLAERLHRLSPRATQTLLRLNCAALSESLLESELFGYERGAFTGAAKAKPGLLETADGGTVFLDEIGELPLPIQVKLLRVIEDRKVLRVGALTPFPIDVRFLAATNRDLEVEIERGHFRRDLYFRLNGITLLIPPLRERVSEVEALAHEFLRHASERNGRATPPAIAGAALALLQQYDWPGNIRELRNVMERAALLCVGAEIQLEHLPIEKMRDGRKPGGARPPELLTVLPPAPPRVEERAPPGPALYSSGADRQRIVDALVRAGGNQTAAARLLGIARRTLINRLIAYKIPRPRTSTNPRVDLVARPGRAPSR
jgi:DNA-binding NtrC family response regulator